MLRLWRTVALLTTIRVCAAVHDLTTETFNEFVSGSNVSMVAFYAPWCAVCQDLQPVLEQVEAQGWRVARVDCTKETAICANYQTPIYPTLRLFDGHENSIYNGARTVRDMVATLGRRSLPLVSKLLSPEDVQSFSRHDRVTVVGYFDESDQGSRSAFTDLARQFRNDYLFAAIADDGFGSVEDMVKPAVVLYKDFDERRNVFGGPFESVALTDFLLDSATPLIRQVGVDLPESFKVARGVPVAYMMAGAGQQRERLLEAAKPLARLTREKMLWASLDPVAHPELASELLPQSNAAAAFAIRELATDFIFSVEMASDSEDLFAQRLEAVVDDFFSGKLKANNSRALYAAEDMKGPGWSTTSHGEL